VHLLTFSRHLFPSTNLSNTTPPTCKVRDWPTLLRLLLLLLLRKNSLVVGVIASQASRKGALNSRYLCTKKKKANLFLAHKALASLIRDTKIGTRLEREEKKAEMAGAAIVEDEEEVASEDEDGEEDGVENERREAALAEAMTWLAEQFGDELA
jgi:hypothetical protein